jgi:hypothetical protein
MKIIGLDVGRGSAVLCCLESFPDNIQQHYRALKREKKFYKISCDRSGVEKLLSFNPQGIVLEPSGHWYSHFWVTVAKHHRIPIYWVSHTDLYGARKNYGFTNKRDEEDALCLAATYFDDKFIDSQGKKRYLRYYYDEIITNLRELFLAKEQLQKLRTNLVSQLRQRLSYEFPEVSRHTMDLGISGYTPIIQWLAFKHPEPRYDNKYKLSVAHELSITISTYTRNHAKIIIDIEERYTNHLDKLEKAIAQAQFARYNKVFDRFGFGTTLRALLLINIFPIEKFLVNGMPLIEREDGQKRDRSLRRFQAFLGMSYKFHQSGNKVARTFGGSTIMRSHLYVWAVCMIAPGGYRIKSHIGKDLSDRYQELRKTVKGKDALIRILFKATRLLYRELIKELR